MYGSVRIVTIRLNGSVYTLPAIEKVLSQNRDMRNILDTFMIPPNVPFIPPVPLLIIPPRLSVYEGNNILPVANTGIGGVGGGSVTGVDDNTYTTGRGTQGIGGLVSSRSQSTGTGEL